MNSHASRSGTTRPSRSRSAAVLGLPADAARSRRLPRSAAAAAGLALGLALTTPTPATADVGAVAVSTSAVPAYDHIVVVVEENHTADQVASLPFLSSLLAGGASFTDAHAETHPSQPNYLALWAGQDFGVPDNTCTTLSGDNLGAQALAAGRSVKGYAEDLPAAGSTVCRAGAYAKKHNPIATFTQTAGAATNLPLTAFPDDYTRLPRLAYVLPNLDHDMHDGSVQAGDAWLQQHLGGYAEWARTHDSLLLVTFDEDDGMHGNRILNLLYGAHVKAGSYADPITHANDLATIEASLGLPALTTAPPITAAFDTTGAAPTCTATPAAQRSPSAPAGDPQPPSAGPSPLAVTTPLSRGLSGTGPLGAGTYSFRDFTAGANGVGLPPAGLTGAGVDRTVVEMTPHTSTKGGTVPTRPYTTNQLSLLEASGSPRLSAFTLQGTDQGHLYNGLRVEHATDARITDVKVAAVPGNKNFPPGETFGINDYRTTGSVYCGIEVDGSGVGAAGFGANDSTSITIEDAYVHDNPHSAALTFWQSRDITLTDVRVQSTHSGLNFERDAGTITITRPDLSGSTGGHDLAFNSDREGAHVTITDPVLPPSGRLRILVAKTYLGKPNQQQRSDIRVLIAGVDRTGAVVQWIG